jgi:succinate dehydrogenase subunit C
MSARREAQLWIAQRFTAALLAVCVIVHLITIIYAVRGGLSAAEILGRTRGSIAWAAFYSLFVLAVSVHGAIGLRTIAAEWLGLRGKGAAAAILFIGLVLAALGMRAVIAVVA